MVQFCNIFAVVTKGLRRPSAVCVLPRYGGAFSGMGGFGDMASKAFLIMALKSRLLCILTTMKNWLLGVFGGI